METLAALVGLLVVAVLVLAGAVLYLLPTVIGFGRHARLAWPLTIINVFLGWTLLGWVVALAMAVGPTSARERT